MRHTCNQINTINKREKLGHGEHMGRKTKTSPFTLFLAIAVCIFSSYNLSN